MTERPWQQRASDCKQARCPWRSARHEHLLSKRCTFTAEVIVLKAPLVPLPVSEFPAPLLDQWLNYTDSLDSAVGASPKDLARYRGTAGWLTTRLLGTRHDTPTEGRSGPHRAIVDARLQLALRQDGVLARRGQGGPGQQRGGEQGREAAASRGHAAGDGEGPGMARARRAGEPRSVDGERGWSDTAALRAVGRLAREAGGGGALVKARARARARRCRAALRVTGLPCPPRRSFKSWVFHKKISSPEDRKVLHP